MSQGAKRPYAEMLETARHIQTTLAPYCERIEIAGSLRRQRPLVGDIELCAIPLRPKVAQPSLFDPNPEPQIDMKAETALGHFLKSRIKKAQWIQNGLKLKSFYYRAIRVDLFLPVPANWGWRYMLATGSGEFNKWLVTSQAANGAMPPDMKSDEGFLWRYLGQGVWDKLDTPDEAAVFAALGLPAIPLTMRDGHEWLRLLDKVAAV